MGTETKIEWCDHTFNPWIGCSRVHTGCLNCYAEELMDHRYGKAKWGVGGTRVRTAPDNWRKPLAWNKVAELDGVRRKVFCASLADVFEDWPGQVLSHRIETDPACPENGFNETKFRAPLWWRRDRGVIEYGGVTVNRSQEERRATLDDVRADLFRLIDATPWLDWLLLTKRPENVRRMWPEKEDKRPIFPGMPGPLGEPVPCMVTGARRSNVWLGTSVSDQATADKAIPELLKCRDLTPVLFLSAEPLVGPVDFSRWLGLLRYAEDAVIRAMPHGMTIPDSRAGSTVKTYSALLDWIIAGGESGRGARRCDVAWVRSIVSQCQASRVPCFVKQLGSKPIVCDGETGGQPIILNLRDSKGGDWIEWPADQRVRQFPSAIA